MRELTVTTERRTQLVDITSDVRDVVEGSAGTAVLVYARVPLAPWFVLAGVFPLGFLLYRRNL